MTWIQINIIERERETERREINERRDRGKETDRHRNGEKVRDERNEIKRKGVRKKSKGFENGEGDRDRDK